MVLSYHSAILITDHIRALRRNPCRNLFNRFFLSVLPSRVARWYYLVCLKDDPGLMGWGVQCSPVTGQGPSLSHLTIYFYNSAIKLRACYCYLVCLLLEGWHLLRPDSKRPQKFRMCDQKSFNIGIRNALGLMLKIWHFPFWFLWVKDDCFHC